MELLGLVDVPIWLFLTLIVILLIYIHHVRTYSFFKNLGIPTPTPLPLIGNVLPLFTKGFITSDSELYNKYGNMYGTYEIGRHNLFIKDADTIREVMVRNFDSFADRPDLGVSKKGVMGKIITRIRGKHWKHIRNAITPTFTSGKLRQYSDLINTAADTSLKNLEKLAKSGEKFEAKEFFGAYTMDVIASTAFGVQTDAQNNDKDPYIVNARKLMNFSLFKPSVLLTLFFPKLLKFINKWCNTQIADFSNSKEARFFLNVTEEALRIRKDDNATYKDFLQLMANIHDPDLKEDGENDFDKDGNFVRKGLTTHEVLAQAFIFFLAGFETTATTLSFTAYHLATNPDVMKKVVEEIDSELNGETPNHDNTTKLHYLEQCINESLRLYPPVIRLSREVTREVKIHDVMIPLGTTVSIPIWGIHHDPDIYPDPDLFKPERFSKEEIEKRNPFHFMPFGAGPRNCIGMRLALLEIKVVLVKILQKLKIVTCEDTQIPLKLDERKTRFLQTENGVWLKLDQRSDI